MLNIYDADGHLDRGRVMDELDGLLFQHASAVKVLGVGAARTALRTKLLNLLDECSEGFTANPLDAPSMVTDYINACKPAWRSAAGAVPRTEGTPRAEDAIRRNR